MISPRILFEGDPAEAYKYAGVAKEFGRSTFAAGIISKVWRLGEDVQIRVMNNIQARICKVWIEAGEPTKQFVARLMASVYNKLLYQRIQLKTETSVDPYWRAKQYSNPLELAGFDADGYFNDAIGDIGDLNWQNDTDVVTWFGLGKYHVHRYDSPRLEFKNTRIYRKGKKSKSCPEKIVGACINKQSGSRFLAVSVTRDNDSHADTLSVWMAGSFKDEWELMTQMPTLDSGAQLFTPVFFNNSGTEAVAVLNRYEAPAAANRRLKITITKDEETQLLSASYVIENPYPGSLETKTYTETSITTSISGTSLLFSDYYHTLNRTVDTVDEIVDLIIAVEGTSTYSYNGTVFETDEFGDPGTGVFWYSIDGESIIGAATGEFRVVKNLISDIVNRIILPFSSSRNSVYTSVSGGVPSPDFSGSVHELFRSSVEYVNADLRVPVLLVKETKGVDSNPYSSDAYTNESWGTQVRNATIGNIYYRLYGEDKTSLDTSIVAEETVLLYEYNYAMDRLTPLDNFWPFYPRTVGYPIFEPLETGYELNSYESVYTWYSWDYLVGSMESLLIRKDASVFLSYLYDEYIGYLDSHEVFMMPYLTDGNPKALAGTYFNAEFPYDTFFYLSVM